jgi:rhamnose transport system ATP-binding protein
LARSHLSPPLLTLTGIAKSFGGTRALVSATLQLHSGSITALVGENGAGKSTLVKILTGVYQPEAGTITLDGQPIRIRSPRHALHLGLSVIHQEAVVFDELTVAENIFVTARPRRFGVIDWRRMREEAARLLARLGCNIEPTAPLKMLSVAQKHVVQVARALSHDSRIVIMDEPTAALSHHEAEELLKIAQELKREGRAILFISHKFDEVFQVADRYAVFRDGLTVEGGLLRDTTVDALVTAMVGRSVGEQYPKSPIPLGAEVLRVEHLSRRDEYADISFDLRRGEILGVYGLIGAGRSELVQSLFGVTRADAGRIVLQQETVSPQHPAEAIALQIAYVPEDRQHQGAILEFSIAENLTLASLLQLSRWGWLSGRRTEEAAAQWAGRLHVKYASLKQPLSQLSGGNQQKVVLAKWLMTAPSVLIVDEPTKGIDVGSKAAVHQLLVELVGQGLAVILVSSDLPEVLGLSDRVLVMRRGRIVGLLDRSHLEAECVLRLATAA